MSDVIEKTAATQAAVDFYMENSRIHPTSGLREINRDAFLKRMEEEHGITKKEAQRFQDAVNFETTVAAGVALSDLEKKIAEASDDDLKNDEYRRNMSSTVRVPTFGGNTEVTLFAERAAPIPGPAGEDGERRMSISHGRVKTTINLKSRIAKDFHDDAKSRIRAALNITD
jgi:hypothetical protein